MVGNAMKDYIDPKQATPLDIERAERDRPGHTCVDDRIPGHCPACNRLKWLEEAKAVIAKRRKLAS